MMKLSELSVSCRIIIFCSLFITLLAAVGGVAAIFPGLFQLGVAEQFLLYTLVGLTRTDTLIFSVLSGIVSLIVVAATVFWARVRFWLAILLNKKSAILVNASLVFTSIFCGVLILEIAFRIIDDVPLWSFENRLVKQQGLLRVHTANIYDPLVGWVLKPGISVSPTSADSSFTTGSLGIRMNQPTVQPLSLGGVLAVGDSFTAGSEVGDSQTWPAQLQKLMGMPVVNAGTGAWGSGQIILRAEKLYHILKSTAVVVSFLEDDILRAGYKIYGGGHKPWFSISNNDELIHHNNPVPDFDSSIVDADVPWLGYFHLSTLVLEKLGYGDWWRGLNTAYTRTGADPVEVTCRLVDRFSQKMRREGIPFLLVLQYGGSNIVRLSKRQDHVARVVSCAEQYGIALLDTWDELHQIYSRDSDALKKLYVMHDEGRIFGHMSAQGNALIAKLIAEKLKPLSVW